MPLIPVELPDPLPNWVVSLSSLKVPAGFPSPAADDLEEPVDPIAWVMRNEETTFWWKIDGDSLVDAGIHDGDIIAVDRDGKRRHGRIVVALVEGELTAKILECRRVGDAVEYWLVPANRTGDYQPIRMTEGSEVWGVVAGVVRRCAIG